MIKPVFERPLAAINLNNTNTELVSKDISPVHRGGRSKKSMNKFFCVCRNFLSEKLLKWIAQLWIRDFIVSTYIWKTILKKTVVPSCTSVWLRVKVQRCFLGDDVELGAGNRCRIHSLRLSHNKTWRGQRHSLHQREIGEKLKNFTSWRTPGIFWRNLESGFRI